MKNKIDSISVIVCVHNNQGNIAACLSSLSKQAQIDIPLEILVVDDDSKDKSIQIASDFISNHDINIKYIRNSKNLGPALVRNIGVENASGDLLLFTDGDCVPPNNWVESIYQFFLESDIQLFTGSRNETGNNRAAIFRLIDYVLYSPKTLLSKRLVVNLQSIESKSTPKIMASTNNFASLRSLWQEIGGMPTDFTKPGGEDLKFEYEALIRGYSMGFDPNILVDHNHPISNHALISKMIHNGEATLRLILNTNGFFTKQDFINRGHFCSMKFFVISITFILILLVLFFISPPVGLMLLMVPFAYFLHQVFLAYRAVKNHSVTNPEYTKHIKISDLLLFPLYSTFSRLGAFANYYYKATTIKKETTEFSKKLREILNKKDNFYHLERNSASPIRTVSVVVTFFGNIDLVAQTFISLLKQSISSEINSYEIVIVNDSSSDHKEYFEKIFGSFQSTNATLKYLELGKNLGRSIARNIGIANSNGELVVLLDGDMIAPVTFIQDHIDTNNQNERAVVTGLNKDYLGKREEFLETRGISELYKESNDDFRIERIVPESWKPSFPEVNSNNFGKVCHLIKDTDRFRLFGKGSVHGVWTLPFMFLAGNVSTRRKYLLQVGGFSDLFKGWGLEDTYLGAKLICIGLYLIPLDKSFPVHRKTPKEELGDRFIDFERNLKLYEKLLNTSFKKQLELDLDQYRKNVSEIF